MVAAAERGPTTIHIRGQPVHFPPISDDDARLSAASRSHTVGAVDAASSWFESNATWWAVARRTLREGSNGGTRRSLLHIAILGFSNLNGCGGHDLGFNATPRLLCDPAFAWSRRLHDQLQDHVRRISRSGSSNLRVRTSTFAKAAVDPTFFAHCTSQMLPSDADVVLLEAGANMYDAEASGETGLELALPAIRAAAPHAALSLVSWVPPSSVAKWQSARLRELILRDARIHAVDVVDVPILLADASAAGRGRRAALGQWYMMNGANHHPTRPGHLLIGEVAARHLLRRLTAAASEMAASETATSERVASEMAGTAAGARARARPGEQRQRESGGRSREGVNERVVDGAAKAALTPRAASSSTGTAAAAARNEQCYNTADQLPVHSLTGSWRLVDEGGRGKGVSKLGYVSTQEGAGSLVLGPLPVLRARGTTSTAFPVCNTIRLGFHLSTRPGQGTLRLTCVGPCSCSSIGRPGRNGIWASVHPFPLISTDARAAARVARIVNEARAASDAVLASPATRELSVTATTEFTLVHRRTHAARAREPQQCLLHISHLILANGTDAVKNATRVRVDTLSQHHEEARRGMMYKLRGLHNCVA